MNKKPYIIAGVTFAALALGTTLFDHFTKSDPDAPQAGCVIAEDTQGTTRKMADTYKAWLPEQLKMCATADRAKVDTVLITSETRTGTTTAVPLDLRADIKYTGNAVNDAKLIGDKLDEYTDEVESRIFNAPQQKRGGTDLVGLVCVASDLLAGRSSKTLIINTDGMNDHQPYKLRSIALDADSIAGYVSEIEASWPADCDLSGTKVYMYGTGIGTGTERLTAEQLSGVEAFWRALYSAAGAEVIKYQRQP